jgi:hypothetical protein
VAPAAHGGGAEYRLDPAAHPACRLRLLRPKGIENLHDQPGIDCRYRQLADHRIDIGCERVAPLLPMLGVAPSRLVAGDELFRRFAEGPPLGHRKPLRRALGGLGVERV